MRRNDLDVTDSIRTTDPGQVRGEVMHVFRSLYDSKTPRTAPAAIERA
ncbi:MAG: hypothetical protein O3A06_07155 [Proteobacteria bacterium]|nr:hypothetical protein [Pseudomonadota bacterium]MDA0982795.1 hypothetical protein [Pseudomonadota bacterium]